MTTSRRLTLARLAPVCVALFVIAPAAAWAQQLWSGIIAPSRAINWSNAGLPATLADGETTPNPYTPPTRTTICASFTPSSFSGMSSSNYVAPSAVNSALASCAAGEVVSLAAGSYYFSSGIDFAGHSNVTLRGAGANQTLLYFNGLVDCFSGDAAVCVQSNDHSNYYNGPSNTASWTAGYTQSTTQVTLSSVANLSVGMTITLDQLDDAQFDPGSAWVCGATAICVGQSGVDNGVRQNREQAEVEHVTAISGDTVTISPGLDVNFNECQNVSGGCSPGAWWANSDVEGDGVEDLSIDLSKVPNSNVWVAIGIVNGYENWVLGCRTINSQRNHIWLVDSGRSLVVSNYFYGTVDASSESYGVEEFLDSDDLIVNNIGQHVVSMLVPQATIGNVWAYNFAIDDYYTSSNGYLIGALEPHSGGAEYNLAEGNVLPIFDGDSIHGTQNFQTLFRNELFGADPAAATRVNGAFALSDSVFHRGYNVIGNVLGYPGFSSTYQAGYSAPFPIVYSIGGSNRSDFFPLDPLAANWLFRWGNYDVVNAAVRWDDSEVPSGLVETPGYEQSLSPATADGTTTTFTATLANASSSEPIVAGSTKIIGEGWSESSSALVTPGISAFDSGSGTLVGGTTQLETNFTGVCVSSGSVNYTTGALTITFCDPPPSGTPMYAAYLQQTSTASPYAVSVPSSESLPASFFLSGEPSFWETAYGTPPWPAIGPDVSGGSGAGGYAYPNPAELCWTNEPYDSNYTTGNQATITSATESGSTATFTLSAAPPSSFTVGQTVWVTGASVNGYNGGFQIATVSSSSPYTVTGTLFTKSLGSDSGGTMTANAAHVFSASSCYPGNSGGTPGFNHFGGGRGRIWLLDWTARIAQEIGTLALF